MLMLSMTLAARFGAVVRIMTTVVLFDTCRCCPIRYSFLIVMSTVVVYDAISVSMRWFASPRMSYKPKSEQNNDLVTKSINGIVRWVLGKDRFRQRTIKFDCCNWQCLPYNL